MREFLSILVFIVLLVPSVCAQQMTGTHDFISPDSIKVDVLPQFDNFIFDFSDLGIEMPVYNPDDYETNILSWKPDHAYFFNMPQKYGEEGNNFLQPFRQLPNLKSLPHLKK